MPIENLEQLKAVLRKLVDYDWAVEMDDYQNNCEGPEGNQRQGHIFETLVDLDNFIRGTSYTPISYVQPPTDEPAGSDAKCGEASNINNKGREAQIALGGDCGVVMSQRIFNSPGVCVNPAPAEQRLEVEFDDYLDLIQYAQDHIRHASASNVLATGSSRSCAVASLDSAVGRLQDARAALAGGLVLPPIYA
jgi:hypothetical protein